jgi:hypothetical protein
MKIEEITHITPIIKLWLHQAAIQLNSMYGNRYDLTRFDLKSHLKCGGRLTLCVGKGRVYGVMLATLTENQWDFGKRLYIQDTIYSAHPRATKLLIDDFINYGRQNADEIITMVGEHTNIKGASLEKLGFKPVELVYRLEV